ncbi:toll/interleukin-1 receptor domain-containing protein [Hoyosella sp. YIM 151337]|uniref:toll/interleukin-1 receptor domain-containing protein n=1 Tax=Hoyosella sp. YIM 151337 TaxID=2992742 RepID=UPI0022366ADA|nr:toll/interleukin-1 receptor domain-containing protein [Hoyosella sp. YIM 151337]MCW4353418.1 toll/interleukin-1 receptor domain-containing protein [Hoyosella sp. YIM 151337]
MTAAGGKHVFISYVREDKDEVDKLCTVFDAVNIPYWRDLKNLEPGDAWKTRIREAIRSKALIFLACFSSNTATRQKSYMNEEITEAVGEFRKLAPGETWLIPVRLHDVKVPEWDLGAGRTLSDLNFVDLFGDQYTANIARLITKILEMMGGPAADSATVRTAINEAADAERPTLLRRLTKELVPVEEKRIEIDGIVSQEASRIVKAMKDETQFPMTLPQGITEHDRLVQSVETAQRYWKLTEPYCWSLQVAARWAPDAQTLKPWANAMKALHSQSIVIQPGSDALADLRAVPIVASVFVAALAALGQERWDNLRTLLVDVAVLKYSSSTEKTALLDAVSPFTPFQNTPNDTASTLARTIIEGEDAEAAAKAYMEKKARRYYTPVAEWLFRAVRPAFDEQFVSDDEYAEKFDETEIMLGLLSQDNQFMAAKARPGSYFHGRSMWFGRSAWRSRNAYISPVQAVINEIEDRQQRWGPLQAGLFGGDLDRARKAAAAYNELFTQYRQNFW